MRFTNWQTLALLCLSCLLCTLAVHADNWPQWRGPQGDGVSLETGLPANWSETENLAWKLALPGMGGSTPVIWGDRLFLTSESEKGLVLFCASTQGKELWQRVLSEQKGRRARGDEGGAASASPSTDGRYVYTFVGSGEFTCHDFDGKEIWRFNAQDRYGRFRIQFGITSTPVLYQGKLYWQLIHDGGGFVICVDAATGRDVWKVERPSDGYAENKHSYASAQLWHKGDDAYLVVHGNDYTTAHRLDNGSEIWRLSGLNPQDDPARRYHPTLRFVASPLVTPDLIVVPTAKGGPVVGVKPTAQSKFDLKSDYVQWLRGKETPDVPCPLVRDGLVYLCRENGVFLCLDAVTGKELYNQRLHPARYRASPTYADGKIYCTARDGVVTVVQAGKEFKKLSENKLPDDFAASPAFAQGKLFLRGYQTLYCIAAK
jgi:outer membrane protein assembly factor BamB